MRHSVGRVANCWDNSVAEPFFSTLKKELVSQTRYAPETKPAGRYPLGSAATTHGEPTPPSTTKPPQNGRTTTDNN